MRLVTFDMGSGADPSTSASSGRVEDVRLAVAILAGAVSVAEAELAGAAFATRAATRKVLRACRAFETAVAGPAIAAVNTAHMPSPSTLKTIAAVEAVRASMPSAATRATIATVEAAHHAVSRQLKG
jgi:hypothetical protein